MAGYLTHLAADEVFVIRLGQHAVQGNGPAIGRIILGDRGRVSRGAPWTGGGVSMSRRLSGGRFDDHCRFGAARTQSGRGKHNRPRHALGELRRAVVAINGLEVSATDSAREAEARAATGRSIFGVNIALEFLAAAEAEAVRRLHAFAAGTAADYDAAHLRDSA